MNFSDFVGKLKDAGWVDRNDAQHDRIHRLWEELFPEQVTIARLEEDQAVLEGRILELKKELTRH